jgi:hypothetical protein
MHTFAFESYGVKIRIESNRKRIIERVRSMAYVSLLGRLVEIAPETAEHVFIVNKTPETMTFSLDGEHLGDNPNTKGFYHYFESRLRVLVAEYAEDLVFLHAGVVAWKGKAIVFPADSFQGKTTLVAALVRRGAVYYSDDYAILDADGRVHPFPRRLSIRHPIRPEIRSNVAAATLGGLVGNVPLAVDAVILTRFSANGKWRPRTLTPGNGLMQMIPQAIPLKANTQLTLDILKTVANRAIISQSLRPDIRSCVDDIIKFLDKRLF